MNPKARRAPQARAKKWRARGLVRDALIVATVAGGLLAVGLLDGDTGIGHWLDLRRDVAAANARIAEIAARNDARAAEAAALESDSIAIESAIREDLGLARPGEWVVREEGFSTLRNP